LDLTPLQVVVEKKATPTIQPYTRVPRGLEKHVLKEITTIGIIVIKESEVFPSGRKKISHPIVCHYIQKSEMQEWV
jgi:hypothetical protein